MSDTRHKDKQWNLGEIHASCASWEQVQMALLMDIRDELKTLNRLLHCPNFQNIPHKLEHIARNTIKRRNQKTT